jgi:hypothetical protein
MKFLEKLIEIWKNDLENIQVDGYSRKVIEVDSRITGRKEFDEKILTFKLEDLKKDNDIIDDYGHKFYSRWGYDVINLFIEKLKGDEDFTPSSNWTEITFKNDFADWIYYNRYTFRVSVFNPVKILRDEKLKLLGL